MNLREMKQMAQKAFKDKIGNKVIEEIKTTNNEGVTHEKPVHKNIKTNIEEGSSYEE